jgi:hypothetical protein
MTSPTSDHDIRALLDDAVADVEPRRGLDDITARTGRGRRSRIWGTAGAVVATAAVIASVSLVGRLPGTTGTGGDDGAGPAREGGAAPSSVTVYFVGETAAGPRLFHERRQFGGRPDALAWSLSNVVEGNALDPDYTSLWPQGTSVRSAKRTGPVLEVDLSGPVVSRPASMSLPAANVAVQQVVRTAQDVSGTRLPVRFLHDGQPTASLLGTSTAEPVARSGDDMTLAPVFISSPEDGSFVTSPFTVKGEAAAFEANVQWELKQGDTVVRRGFTTAQECCTLSPYSFRVSAPPGTYTLVVHDEDVSGGEGTPASRDTKLVRVQ